MTADRARTAFARRAWREAYSELVAAEERADAEDLERLAIAAHLIGADDWVDRWTNASRAHEEQGNHARAARCAFWLAFGLLTEGHVARGGGWLGRAHEILDCKGPRGRALRERNALRVALHPLAMSALVNQI